MAAHPACAHTTPACLDGPATDGPATDGPDPDAEATLRALLAQPPGSRARLHARRGGTPIAALQAQLARLIQAEALTAAEVDCLPVLGRVLRAGEARPALERLLLDPQASVARRSMAWAALFHEPDGPALMDRLGHATRIRLADPWIRPLVTMAATDPDAQQAVADLIEITPALWREAMVARIEHWRRRRGTRAIEAYAVALLAPALVDTWPLLFGHVLSEGDPDRPPRGEPGR